MGKALDAFEKATGLAVRFVPVGRDGAAAPAQALCALLCAEPLGRAACLAALNLAERQSHAQPEACRVQCLAGLTELAVRVEVEGQPVGLLLGGPVWDRRPSRSHCAALQARLRGAGLRFSGCQFRAGYFGTGVASRAQLQAKARLLWMLAQHVAEASGRGLLRGDAREPQTVVRAKAFAQAHLLEELRTRDAARAVHLSLAHFCRLFKQTTGLTFTGFLSRCRVQKARELLGDFSLRITEVAYSAGFQSIPHFNHTFKRYTGQSPKQYRRGL